jgi:recombinational DNA repair protein (RecF pathway)
MSQEYISEGIILELEPIDEDLRVSIFTPFYGKITAKAKSARKITSKLRGHIEPGNLILCRIVSNKNFQLVDALKQKKLNLNPTNLSFLNKILAELQPEENLYFELKREKFDWNYILKILGWDPQEAKCHNCGAKNPRFFDINFQQFYCQKCVLSLKIPKNELLYL